MSAFFSVKCSGFSSQKISTNCCKQEDSFHLFKFTKYNTILDDADSANCNNFVPSQRSQKNTTKAKNTVNKLLDRGS